MLLTGIYTLSFPHARNRENITRRLDEIFYGEALKNEIRHSITSKMPDFVIVATLDKLIQPTYNDC